MRIAILREAARTRRRQWSVFVPAVALLLAAPSAAQAAQGLVGVTNHGQVVRLSDQTLPPFTRAIHGDGPVTLAVAADGSTVRVIDRDVDVVVNLRTGAASPAAPPTYAPGDPHAGQRPALAADTLPDGRLVGFDADAGNFVVQRATGRPLSTSPALPGGFRNPIRVNVAPDGSGWLAARLPVRAHQSRLVRFDPTTGGLGDADGPFLLRELVALAAVGPVPSDTGRPSARISVPRQESLRTVRAHGGVVARLRVSEGGQTLVTARDQEGADDRLRDRDP